jgi:hypothetical protein
MSLEQDLDRAAKAKAALANPAIAEAFENVRKAIHDAWEAAPVRDVEGQQILRLQLKLLGDVRANLEAAIADGKIAAAEVDRRNKPKLADFRR